MALATKQPKGASEKLAGAAIKLDYLQRFMKAYPVTENEIGMLDHYSGQKALFFSIGTFFLGLACEVKFHAVFAHQTGTPTPEAHALATWGFGAFVVLAAVFGIVGGIAAWRGHSAWKHIRGESAERVVGR